MERKNSFTKEDLIKAGTGEMFGPGNSHLPSVNMLMMDRIIKITEDGGEHGKGEIIAELDISAANQIPTKTSITLLLSSSIIIHDVKVG